MTTRAIRMDHAHNTALRLIKAMTREELEAWAGIVAGALAGEMKIDAYENWIHHMEERAAKLEARNQEVKVENP